MPFWDTLRRFGTLGDVLGHFWIASGALAPSAFLGHFCDRVVRLLLAVWSVYCVVTLSPSAIFCFWRAVKSPLSFM